MTKTYERLIHDDAGAEPIGPGDFETLAASVFYDKAGHLVGVDRTNNVIFGVILAATGEFRTGCGEWAIFDDTQRCLR